MLGYAQNANSYRRGVRDTTWRMLRGLDIAETDIDAQHLDFQMNRFQITLDIDFEIVHDNPNLTAGIDNPSNSHACNDKHDVQDRVAREFQEKLRDPSFTEELQSALSKNPKKSVVEHNIEVTHAHSEAYHHHESCPACNGHKKRPCPNGKCVNGRENCPRVGCAQGYVTCYRCNGVGTITYRGPDGHQKIAFCPNPKCHGGREKCKVCDNDGMVRCGTCNGHAVVTCDVCQVNGRPIGQVTFHQRARLVRKPKRGCRQLDVPHAWVATHLGDDVSHILFWSTRKADAETIQKDGGGFQVRLTAGVPSGEGALAIGDHETRVTAIGEYPELRFEDAVLERVLDDHRRRILNATGRGAFALAEQNVVFAEAARAARTGDALDTSNFQRLLDTNALTADFVASIREHLDRCVDDLMRKPYWRSWATAAPVIALSGAAMWFFDPLLGAAREIEQAQHVREWRMVADTALPVVLAFTAAVVARVRGRTAAESALDRSDVRGSKPRGGFFAGFLAVVAALTVTWLGTEGPGRGPRPLASDPTHVLEVGFTNLGSTLGLSVTETKPTVSQPDGHDRTQAPPRDSAAYVRTLQQRLADLGYYDGAIDGIRGPKTRNAVAEMHQDAQLPTASDAGRYDNKPLALAKAIQQGLIER